MPFVRCQRRAGERMRKTERASVGFGLVGVEGTVENSLGHRGGHCADAVSVTLCSRSRLFGSDPTVEVYDKARNYRDLLRP
jgi:hypothetical protein